MKKTAVFLFVALALVLSACATKNLGLVPRAASTQAPPGYDYSAGEQGVAQPPAAPGSKTTDGYDSTGSNGGFAVAQQRLIVQNV
jgi:hypothetical protein